MSHNPRNASGLPYSQYNMSILSNKVDIKEVSECPAHVLVSHQHANNV